MTRRGADRDAEGRAACASTGFFHLIQLVIIEQMLSMGDETYARLEWKVLLRIYHDLQRILGEAVEEAGRSSR